MPSSTLIFHLTGKAAADIDSMVLFVGNFAIRIRSEGDMVDMANSLILMDVDPVELISAVDMARMMLEMECVVKEANRIVNKPHRRVQERFKYAVRYILTFFKKELRKHRL
jgi:hypothetical protein